MRPAVDRHLAATLALGALLLLLYALIARLAEGFYYHVDLANVPIHLFTGLFLAAGALSLSLLWLIPRLPRARVGFLLLLLSGLVMRLLLFDSVPVLEIDFYRYLWDGAVLANGFNPYALPPAQVAGSELHTLAQQAGPVFERINYRDLSTIYPPLAQALFAIAHWLDPWRLDALRYLYLAADIGTLLLLLAALARLDRSPGWILLYWWNPLLIVFVYNGLHMDILLLPLLAAAFLLVSARRPIAAAAALALASAIKLWPLILIPFALRPLLAEPGRFVLGGLLAATIAGLALAPMLGYATADHSGLAAFGQTWQRNSALFPLLVDALAAFSADPEWLARLLVGFMLILLMAYLLRRSPREPGDILAPMTIVTVALFLLSPVQLPWYCLWILPLLCFYPQPALLAMLALMPLYFLRFHPDYRDAAFDQYIVWLQYLPPLLLAIGLRGYRRLSTQPGLMSHV